MSVAKGDPAGSWDVEIEAGSVLDAAHQAGEAVRLDQAAGRAFHGGRAVLCVHPEGSAGYPALSRAQWEECFRRNMRRGMVWK